MDEELLLLLLLGLGLLLLPVVMPILTWVHSRRTRRRVEQLEDTVVRQAGEIAQLHAAVRRLREDRKEAAAAPATAAAAPSPTPSPETAPSPAPVVTPSPAAAPSPSPVAAPAPPVTAPTTPPVSVPSMPPPAPATPLVLKPAVPPAVEGPKIPAAPAAASPRPAGAKPGEKVVPGDRERPAAAVAAASAASVAAAGAARREPPAAPPPRVPAGPPQPPSPSFDWESLVGVKLFSAIAGIALVLAAIFFLRYSIEHGWLQPPVRVAIGIIVAVALLVVCELKAARKYPATANALDAAAIAILFATFFSAHALWNLIPASVTFALLAIVTALAVLLSIRRESLFIAVLGLLGGFSTPALLSTGENRPIPLFAYLLLLNIGLAWVAHQKRWPVLTWLTLILTTLYQWGWVFKYLHESSLSLAMGVFIVFPLVTMAALALARRDGASDGDDEGGFERTGLISAGLPLLFAAYLASVPQYGARPLLLFGFLLLIDAGLLAIALARHQPLMHVTGAVATLVTMGVWLAASYPGPEANAVALGFTAAFVAFYLFAPVLAERLGRPLDQRGEQAQFAGPLLLFVFPVLAGVNREYLPAWPLFGTLLTLVLASAWRAIAARTGSLYFVAAFFAVATQAVWSAAYLTADRLATGVALYVIFGLVSLAVPIAARRAGRPLEPAWGGGAVLLLSLGLLLFLSTGVIAPEALWALALLLAILNAALFVESAASGLPLLSQIGSVFSWVVLGVWWSRAAGAVGVMPSIAVLTGLSLITLAGHAWTLRSRGAADGDRQSFSQGLYLALAGHLFLMFLATSRAWAVPPWPLFGSLIVLTLAISAAALAVSTPSLHVAGTIAAAIVAAVWGASVASDPQWTPTAFVAFGAVSAYALAWLALTRDRFGEAAAQCAAAVLFIGEIAAILTVEAGTSSGIRRLEGATAAAAPFAAVLLSHVANSAVLLALVARYHWRWVAIAAVAPAWMAVGQWLALVLPAGHGQVLLLSGALCAVFVAYAFLADTRTSGDRDPYLAAILASAMFFFAGRAAFEAAGLSSYVGAIPVLESAVLALLLRKLLRAEPAGQRDTGRLALVAGAALAFITVAIPVQLEHQWITIGWALEGAALAWLYQRVPHRGLLYSSVALLAVVFARLALNPEIFEYQPRGALRIFNWYLYTYVIAAASCMLAGWWLSKTEDRLAQGLPRPSSVLPAVGVILLFLLLNIEIADYYATEPTIAFRFGVTLSQDLTYTIGWLVFGMGLLACGIYMKNRPARVAAVALIAVTTFKCFLYDLRSLEGLYRVASFVGLALALALVSLALQKYVLGHKPPEPGAAGDEARGTGQA